MKENHLRLVRHMAVNIVLLLAAVMVLLLAAAHRTYTRQMERLDIYIGVLSGRTATVQAIVKLLEKEQGK